MMNQNHIGYQAGDILVACDNELNIPTGYLGHSAIVVSPEHIVESVITYPYIQTAPIQEYSSKHPIHAVYRPKNPKLGEAAARYAVWYYQQSETNKQNGINIPPFSFSPTVPLADPWTTVYCSKLIWLCYYYGAGLSLNNDFFLYTPEDIDTELSQSPLFSQMYKHPEFKFVVDS
jgi:uncharacterized protein YycO